MLQIFGSQGHERHCNWMSLQDITMQWMSLQLDVTAMENCIRVAAARLLCVAVSRHFHGLLQLAASKSS